MLNLHLHFLKIYTSMTYNNRLKLIFRISSFFWYIYFFLLIIICSWESKKFWTESEPSYSHKRYAYKKKNIQHQLHTDHHVTFQAYPVSGHHIHGKVEIKIHEIKKSMEIVVQNERLSILGNSGCCRNPFQHIKEELKIQWSKKSSVMKQTEF